MLSMIVRRPDVTRLTSEPALNKYDGECWMRKGVGMATYLPKDLTFLSSAQGLLEPRAILAGAHR